jgi:hypothetical protein
MKVNDSKFVLIEIELNHTRMLDPQIRALISVGIPYPCTLLFSIDTNP